jgi:outer membrane protein OmpA-like peptidoglycan-associated protein
MKKRTRPVFESYEEFAKFLDSNINESEESLDWSKFMTNISTGDFFDDIAKEAFKEARKSFNKSPMAQNKKFKNDFYEVLYDLYQNVKETIDLNKDTRTFDGAGNKIIKTGDSTKTEKKTLIYKGLVNGNVQIANFSDSENKGDWEDLNDFITELNRWNLDWYKPSSPATGNGKKWNSLEYSPKLASYSGAVGQNVIAGYSQQGFDIEKQDNMKSDEGPKSMIDEFKINLSPNKVDDSPAKTIMIVYAIGNITQGGGNAIPETLIKKTMTTEIVPGEIKEYEVPISGENGMFDQGKINIKKKEGIDKLLTAALSPLAGVPESIVITGGASFEGGLEFNKKLVVERSEAVKEYLEKLYPQLVGKISINKSEDPKNGKYSKIQKEDDKEKYPEFRKVYLNIKGVLQGDSYTSSTTKTYELDTEILADSVEIIQYSITTEYFLPKGK